MAEIAKNHRKGATKRRAKKLSTRVDFTPMVDLGFLLITFFMLATTLNKPQTMEIALPSKEKTPESEQTTVKASKAITLLLGQANTVYYYEGTRVNEVDPELHATNFSPGGLRQFLLKRNYEVMEKIRNLRTEKEKKKILRRRIRDPAECNQKGKKCPDCPDQGIG